MEILEDGTIILRSKADIEEYIASLPNTRWYWRLWHWLVRDESYYISKRIKEEIDNGT